jgi:N-acetylglucosamine malate deacetylase 2
MRDDRAEPVVGVESLRRGGVLVLAAHPDDETIGAGALLHRLRDAVVVHLTDGAPHDARFRSIACDREAYARLRRRELAAALATARVPLGRALALGATDQEAVLAIPELARALAALLRELRPALLVTHPYEGGHPDHDAAALIARAAVQLLRRDGRPAPRIVEMTSYHARGGALVTGRFLDGAPAGQLARPLPSREREVKLAMLQCFESQRAALAPFLVSLAEERFRQAPTVDFGAPPQAEPLWYERLGFPMSGARWRSLARRAVQELRVDE